MDDTDYEAERLLDGWELSGPQAYWEARNVALFRRRGEALEFEDVLRHFSLDRARARLHEPPGYRSELRAALTCANTAERGFPEP